MKFTFLAIASLLATGNGQNIPNNEQRNALECDTLLKRAFSNMADDMKSAGVYSSGFERLSKLKMRSYEPITKDNLIEQQREINKLAKCLKITEEKTRIAIEAEEKELRESRLAKSEKVTIKCPKI